MKDFDLEMCQIAAIHLKKLSSVCLSIELRKCEKFHVGNSIECMQAFINNGKLRSATFKISSGDADFERVKLWRQMLMQRSEVKKWSKVTRVRCEVSLFVSTDTVDEDMSEDEEMCYLTNLFLLVHFLGYLGI